MTEQPSESEPSNVDEWTTHALNIQGAIFERWAADAVRKSGSSWTVTATEYPVDFPPPEYGQKSHETALDLRADFTYPDKNALALLIECKKNNPEFVDWIFFEANRSTPPVPHLLTYQITWINNNPVKGPARQFGSCEFELTPTVVDHASETRGTYDDPDTRKKNTKTSMQAINDACHQVAIATQAIVHEEIDPLYNPRAEKPPVLTFVPVIVTTAKLKVLQFDPYWASEETGEIPRNRASLRPVEWLQYLYPLPRHLHFRGAANTPWYRLKKLPICIVNSRYFKRFLGAVPTYHGFKQQG